MRILSAALVLAAFIIGGAISWHGRVVAVPLAASLIWHDRWTGKTLVCHVDLLDPPLQCREGQ